MLSDLLERISGEQIFAPKIRIMKATEGDTMSINIIAGVREGVIRGYRTPGKMQTIRTGLQLWRGDKRSKALAYFREKDVDLVDVLKILFAAGASRSQ